MFWGGILISRDSLGTTAREVINPLEKWHANPLADRMKYSHAGTASQCASMPASRFF